MMPGNLYIRYNVIANHTFVIIFSQIYSMYTVRPPVRSRNCVYVCVGVCMLTHACMYVYVCVYLCVCACVSEGAHECVCMRVCVFHTYAYTQVLALLILSVFTLDSW